MTAIRPAASSSPTIGATIRPSESTPNVCIKLTLCRIAGPIVIATSRFFPPGKWPLATRPHQWLAILGSLRAQRHQSDSPHSGGSPRKQQPRILCRTEPWILHACLGHSRSTRAQPTNGSRGAANRLVCRPKGRTPGEFFSVDSHHQHRYRSAARELPQQRAFVFLQ